MNAITSVNYQIEDLFFPYRFALGHIKAAWDHTAIAAETCVWHGHIVQILVHTALAALEAIPLVNWIVALFDKIIYESCIASSGESSGGVQPPSVFNPPPPAQQMQGLHPVPRSFAGKIPAAALRKLEQAAKKREQEPEAMPLPAARQPSPLPEVVLQQAAAPQAVPQKAALPREVLREKNILFHLVRCLRVGVVQQQEKLGCGSASFKRMGLGSMEDLDAIVKLDLFAHPLNRVAASAALWRSLLADSENPEETMQRIVSDLNLLFAPSISENASMEPFISGLEELQPIFQKAVELIAAALALDAMYEKIRQMIDSLPQLRQEAAEESFQAAVFRQKLMCFFDSVASFYNIANDHIALPEFSGAAKALQASLEQEKEQFAAELGSEESPGLIQKMAELAPSTALKEVVDGFRKTDAQRQILCLKAYLTQPNLKEFWNSNPSKQGVSNLLARQPELAVKNLFELGLGVSQEQNCGSSQLSSDLQPIKSAQG